MECFGQGVSRSRDYCGVESKQKATKRSHNRTFEESGIEFHRAFQTVHNIVRKLSILFECLPDSRNIAVAEDSVAAFEKAELMSIPLDILILEERDKALLDCQRFVR